MTVIAKISFMKINIHEPVQKLVEEGPNIVL